MKITIDTKEDSHEEIRKIIRMLSSLVGERETFSNQPNIFEDSSEDKEEPETNAFANMFGSEPSKLSEENKESTEDEEIKVEEKEDMPEVAEYH